MTCRRSLPFRSCLNKATSDEFIWRYVHNTNQGVMNFYGSGMKFLPHHPWLCSKDRACLRCMAARQTPCHLTCRSSPPCWTMRASQAPERQDRPEGSQEMATKREGEVFLDFGSTKKASKGSA